MKHPPPLAEAIVERAGTWAVRVERHDAEGALVRVRRVGPGGVVAPPADAVLFAFDARGALLGAASGRGEPLSARRTPGRSAARAALSLPAPPGEHPVPSPSAATLLAALLAALRATDEEAVRATAAASERFLGAPEDLPDS